MSKTVQQKKDNPPLEIEVKFLITDLDNIREQLVGMGAESRGRHFEENLRLDDHRASLRDKKALLRLRRDQQATLTFKSEPPAQSDEFKVHQELEVVVSDFKMARMILEALGWQVVQRYEKWRETFTVPEAHVCPEAVVCIDEMPFGNFLEIEGNPQAIRDMGRALGFNWNHRILHNYLAIFDFIRSQAGLPFNDLTFDHFELYSNDFTEALRSLQVDTEPNT